jgi:hypothetical protein
LWLGQELFTAPLVGADGRSRDKRIRFRSDIRYQASASSIFACRHPGAGQSGLSDLYIHSWLTETPQTLGAAACFSWESEPRDSTVRDYEYCGANWTRDGGGKHAFAEASSFEPTQACKTSTGCCGTTLPSCAPFNK